MRTGRTTDLSAIIDPAAYACRLEDPPNWTLWIVWPRAFYLVGKSGLEIINLCPRKNRSKIASRSGQRHLRIHQTSVGAPRVGAAIAVSGHRFVRGSLPSGRRAWPASLDSDVAPFCRGVDCLSQGGVQLSATGEFRGVSGKPKILFVGDPADQAAKLLEQLSQNCELVCVPGPISQLPEVCERPAAVMLVSQDGSAFDPVERCLRNERILRAMPDGVALLTVENRVVWANDCLTSWIGREDIVGQSFYSLFEKIEILGPDFCPFHTALHRHKATSSTLRCQDNRYFQVHAAPVGSGTPDDLYLVVTVCDVTREMQQQQKLEAIHKAGVELADMTAEEVFHLSVDERIQLLKSNILHYTKDLLKFDVVEVRLLAQNSGELLPLLYEGIVQEAAERPLYAKPQGYGVTGFVAATGKSYLCEDTAQDPLYIEGCRGAKSSLTVPLVLHDQVIGTFNVESPQPHAFSESDLQFLEIFSRDVAAALNTWELLVAQQANTAQASVEAIHREVALPVDEILNDAVNIMERYIGHEPSVEERLQRILRNARDIKQLIHKVGQEMAPAEAVPHSPPAPQHPKLKGRRVLVVDADESVRSAGHNLLERFGCVVETTQSGEEAIFMIQACAPTNGYELVIADIRLPDLDGFEFYHRLREAVPDLPVVLMTGFGYDPGHCIVKSRQEGLPSQAILYKPFRLDQLIQTVEKMLDYGTPVKVGPVGDP